MSDEKCVRHFPFEHRYNVVDKRYLFGTRNDLPTLPQRYPIHLDQRLHRHFDRPRVNLRNERRENLNLSHVEVALAGNGLPDVVLLTIFKYLHPLDLVHDVSKVSNRWNILAKIPSNYCNVRVVIDQRSVENGSVNAFLNRGLMCIRQLCLDYHSKLSPDFMDRALPPSMPNVTMLDLGLIQDECINDIIGTLIKCFPNVETLNMDFTVFKLKDDKLIIREAFPRLRNLSLRMYMTHSEGMIRRLEDWDRQLEVLRFGRIWNRCPNLTRFTSLRELHLEGTFPEDVYEKLGKLKTLKKLNLSSESAAPASSMKRLKDLSNLEHFHYEVGCSGAECIPSERLIELFRLPTCNPSHYFPYRLKHLCICYHIPLSHEVVVELITSCPDLESLNITVDRCEETVALIKEKLNKLRLLDATGIFTLGDNAMTLLTGNHLPELRLLKVFDSNLNDDDLAVLAEKRPNLIVTDWMDFYVNWSERGDATLCISDKYDAHFDATLRDLNRMDGFCCMGNMCIFNRCTSNDYDVDWDDPSTYT